MNTACIPQGQGFIGFVTHSHRSELEELLSWCNASMPSPNPEAHAFLGEVRVLEIPNAEMAHYRFGNNEARPSCW